MKRYRIETNSRQITPKHDGKPAIIRDQRTRPVNKIDNLTKSAKPPSPVQIRAAPPFFRRMSSVPAGARLAGHSLCSEEPSIRSSVPSRGFHKSLRCDELSASDLCRGGGLETSASASRPRRMRSIGRSAAGATADARARATIEPRTRPGSSSPIAAATLAVRRPVGFAGATTQAGSGRGRLLAPAAMARGPSRSGTSMVTAASTSP